MERKYKLPVQYDELLSHQKREVREQYIAQQSGKCMYCESLLQNEPKEWVLERPIDLRLFPPNFLKSPVHLQHNHDTGYTEGAVHAYCNAVLWQHEGR